MEGYKKVKSLECEFFEENVEKLFMSGMKFLKIFILFNSRMPDRMRKIFIDPYLEEPEIREISKWEEKKNPGKIHLPPEPLKHNTADEETMEFFRNEIVNLDIYKYLRDFKHYQEHSGKVPKFPIYSVRFLATKTGIKRLIREMYLNSNDTPTSVKLFLVHTAYTSEELEEVLNADSVVEIKRFLITNAEELPSEFFAGGRDYYTTLI